MVTQFFAQVSLVFRDAKIGDHVADAGLLWVESGEERGAGRTAASGVIHLGESESVVAEGIKVWGADFRAEAADIGVAHVVGQYHNYVGSLVGVGCHIKHLQEQVGAVSISL